MNSGARNIIGRTRGFTLVELCIGLIVLSLVMGAVASFTLAVANCWKYSAATDSSRLVVSQMNTRLQKRFMDAKRIGGWRAGGTVEEPAAILFWPKDTNGDGLMQVNEMAVIKYNPDEHTLDLYASNLASDVWIDSDFKMADQIDKFTAGATSTPIVRNVTGAWLDVTNRDSTTALPSVQWELQVTRPDGSIVIEIAAATLRAPFNP